jgi:hypothetical protein
MVLTYKKEHTWPKHLIPWTSNEKYGRMKIQHSSYKEFIKQQMERI